MHEFSENCNEFHAASVKEEICETSSLPFAHVENSQNSAALAFQNYKVKLENDLTEFPKMDIFVLQEICKDQRSVFDYFAEKRLIHGSVFCVACTRAYTLICAKAKLCGYSWRCASCKAKQSVLSGSFFSCAHLSFKKIVHLCYYWSTKMPVGVTRQHLALNQATGGDWYHLLRGVCSWKLGQEPIRLGGPQIVVQTAVFSIVKAKCNSGANSSIPQRWVFGLYDTSVKQGHIRFVDQCDAATLLPIVETVVLPSSILLSYHCSVCDEISHANYTQRTVKHSKDFVDPITGVRGYTNDVEKYWKRAKSMFERMHGTKFEFGQSYLDEFMWREKYGTTPDLAYANLLAHIREKNPC